MGQRRSLKAVIERRFEVFIKSQRKTICVLCEGLLVARRLGLASIGRGMPGEAKIRHKIKRVDRFASNKGVRAEKAMLCLMAWLACVARQTLTVALDWTDIGQGRVLLSAVAARGHRAVPLAWTVMAKGQFTKKRKSRNDAEEQMIRQLLQALGEHPWVLVADRGFARVDLFKKLKDWGICYVIRACGNPWVQTPEWAGQLWNLPRQAGRVRSYRNALYHKQSRVPVHLVVTHKEPAPEPWYLVTNLEDEAEAVASYRRRNWIEQQFRDAKTHMGLDQLGVRAARRIERLMILMAIVMAVAILTGLKWAAEHPGEDPGLTTHKRGRSVSLFLVGIHFLRQDGLPPGFLQFRVTEAVEAL
jgi:hypothetical protein